MRFSYVLGASLGAAAVVASPAHATIFPDNPQYEAVSVEFSGVVTNSITDDIVVLDADGNRVAYTGPVPDYAFDSGDTITISFDAVVPSAEAIAEGFVPIAADGIYRFEIGPPVERLDEFPGFASATNLQGGGGIAAIGSTTGFNGPVIVYDANTDSYSIDPGEVSNTGDNFGLGGFDIPVPVYDIGTDALSFLSLSQLPSAPVSQFFWSGTGDNSGRIPMVVFNFDGQQFLGTSSSGNSDIAFSGAWNLPVFGSDATPVPAPPMIVLFGLAAAGFMSRKKWTQKRKKG